MQVNNYQKQERFKGKDEKFYTASQAIKSVEIYPLN